MLLAQYFSCPFTSASSFRNFKIETIAQGIPSRGFHCQTAHTPRRAAHAVIDMATDCLEGAATGFQVAADWAQNLEIGHDLDWAIESSAACQQLGWIAQRQCWAV